MFINLIYFLPQVYPLVCVAHTGVLDQGSEHHEEADEEVDVYGLHVGNLGQRGVDGVDEGGHGEHGGHPQPHPGRGRASVEPEAHPGHDYYQAAGDVNLEMFGYFTMFSIIDMMFSGSQNCKTLTGKYENHLNTLTFCNN